MKQYLYIAAKVAIPTNDVDKRKNFYLGCVGIRKDGVIVSSRNGSTVDSTALNVKRYILISSSHAEGRTLQKLGKEGIIFVARIFKNDHSFAMARPCGMCRNRIKALSVKKVYYSINNEQYGVWFPDINVDRIYRF
jgi:cytidine deaminase